MGTVTCEIKAGVIVVLHGHFTRVFVLVEKSVVIYACLFFHLISHYFEKRSSSL